MKELFYTSPYKIRLHTIRLEYGKIGEKFILKVFEGEINFKGDFEEKPIEAIFEEEEMLMHLSSIKSVLINGGWKLREKTDVLIKSFRVLRFLSKNKYKIGIPLFFLPIFLPDQLIGIWTLLFVFSCFFFPIMWVILSINSGKIVREAKELRKEPEKILDEYLSRKNDQEYSVGDEDLSKSENNDQDYNVGDEDQSKSENKVSGYAEDSHSCRKRYVESDSPENLKIAINKINNEWSKEKDLVSSSGSLEHNVSLQLLKDSVSSSEDGENYLIKRKIEALDKSNIIFPNIFRYPTEIDNYEPVIEHSQYGQTNIGTETYKSCFSSLVLNQKSYDSCGSKAHLYDYEYLQESIVDKVNYSLEDRFSKAEKYPTPKPVFESSPKSRKIITIPAIPEKPKKPDQPKYFEPKIIPIKFFDYLLILPGIEKTRLNREEEKRVYKENNRLKGELYDAECEYEPKCDKYKEEIELYKWLKQFYKDRDLYIEHIKEKYDLFWSKAVLKWEHDKSIYEADLLGEREEYNNIIKNYESGKLNHITEYFNFKLRLLPSFDWWGNKFDLQFEKQDGILLVELYLPFLRDTEIYKSKEVNHSLELVSATKKESQTFIENILYLLVLRHMWSALQLDYKNYIKMVCCNGHVVHTDPATGKEREDIIMSVSSNSKDLIDIQLDRVEPKACFRKLKGVSASKLTELVPINPILKFNKSDSRFVKGEDVLDGVGEKNLASMDWQEFEHLIREIFEKEYSKPGAEVKITQASRDRGVDAIAFDPDPLHGGKYVIQAKRYTNTVDVSSVRDLYGTVMNEGADRGILVTTSDYGRDSIEFSKDKPLTLLNGSELLHLLKKHGYNAKIDIKEAKKLLEEENKN